MSRRRRASAPTPPGRGSRPPLRTDITVVPFATVPVSATREFRVALSLSPTGRAVTVRSYFREGGGAEMAPVGGTFTVFRAELDAIVSALAAAGAQLDAAVPEPRAQPVHTDTSGAALPPSITGRARDAIIPGCDLCQG